MRGISFSFYPHARVRHSSYALTKTFLHWLKKKHYSEWCFLYLVESQKHLRLPVDIQYGPGTYFLEVLRVTTYPEGCASVTT